MSGFRCRGATWTGSSICGHLDMPEIHAWIQNMEGGPTQEGTMHSNPVEIKEKHDHHSPFLALLSRSRSRRRSRSRSRRRRSRSRSRRSRSRTDEDIPKFSKKIIFVTIF